jgi:pimeloyl-ACP methyl ester carboxylesterase
VIKRRYYCWLLPLFLIFGTAGCGTYIANKMVQAPNTFPESLAPKAPVLLGFHQNFLTNFPKQFVAVGPPAAQLCYRVVGPADYQLTVSSTNWLEQGRPRTEFDFRADLPGRTNRWTAMPRGTVVLLHGYGLAQFSMAPWALRLAQEGWQCVLVDLRGHGRSTGRQIYFGLQEAHDLSQLLDELARRGQLKVPVAAVGESYGAAMALRWEMADPRVHTVVAITPYAGLSNAVMNIHDQYARWLPKFLINAGLKKLPAVLGVPATELDTTTVLARHPVTALFVADTGDRIVPVTDVEHLRVLAAGNSELIVVPDATHETVTYYMADLAPPILAWLSSNTGPDGIVDSPVGTNSFISTH